MCDCLEKTKEILVAKAKEIVEKEVTVSKWVHPGRFANLGYSMNGGPSKVGMEFVAVYVRQKKNGQPEQKETHRSIRIYAEFCPFCGNKYEEQDTPDLKYAKESPALKEKSGSYPAKWEGKVPLKVRMLQTVVSHIPVGQQNAAEIGEEYFVWVNSHGGTAVVFEDATTLGVKPKEFEIIEWHK